MTRFAAQLLFAFQVGGKFRAKTATCEERTIVLHARSPKSAFHKAHEKGKRSQLAYQNDDGEKVTLQFLGILELLQLDPVSAQDEVWYEIKDINVRVLEEGSLIPDYKALEAVRNACKSKGNR